MDLLHELVGLFFLSLVPFLTKRRCTLVLASAFGLLARGLDNSRLPGKTLKDLYSLGLGTVTPTSIIRPLELRGSSGLMLVVLISNSPQLLLSFVYLGYNSLFTSMFLAREWDSYAIHRKALRVTSPKGFQRSTYWLQLPYRYSIPLLGASTILHWLVSQSLFLARVTSLGEDGTELASDSISTCGYSNIALVFVIGLGSLLLVYPLALGLKRFYSTMPITGSCSAAISAACHPPKADVDAAFKIVRWGVVENCDMKTESKDQNVGHCCFTSMGVTRPVQGNLYA